MLRRFYVATAMHAVAIINPNINRYTTSFFLDNTRSPIIFLFLPIIHIIARGAINAKTKNIRRYRTIAIMLDGLIIKTATTAGKLSSI